MNTKRDIEFLFEMGCLKYVPRMWQQFVGRDVDNVAEHTLRVLWIALLLAKKEGVEDCTKIMKMALVHDVAESRTGDVQYMSRMYTERNEDLAVKDMFAQTSLEEFKEVWKEYEERQSIEAKIVKDADNLHGDLELQELFAKGNNVKEEWREVRKLVYEKLFTKSAKELFLAIHQSNPHDWHLLGKNRFTSGDWKPEI